MKMYRTIFIAVLLSAALTDAAAQVKARSTDVFEELDSGSLTLRFFHALTGQPVPGGTVVIQEDVARDGDAGDDVSPGAAAGHHEHAGGHQSTVSLILSRMPSEASVAKRELPP